MKAKLTVLGHPVHPMLVPFPIALYASALVAYIIYAYSMNLFWFRMGVFANGAGVLMAVLAAIPGIADLFGAVPKETPARRDGMVHMMLNVASLVLMATNLAVQYTRWDQVQPDRYLGIVLSLLGVLGTLGAGWYGWRLVQTHRVGVLEEAGQGERTRVIYDRRRQQIPVAFERRHAQPTG